MFKNLSIRNKIMLAFSGAVLLVALVMSMVAVSVNKTKLSERMLQQQLPATLNTIGNALETEVRALSRIAEQLANSEYAQAWLASGKNKAGEALLVSELEQVKKTHGLQAASFSERDSGDYWNERGFLRRLTPEADGWFFTFKNSGKARQVAVYKSPVAGYQIFVNYQQLSGNTLSGVAKSMNDMVKMLSDYKIEQSGFVYLVDQQGKIQIHPQLEANTELSTILPAADATALLQAKEQVVVREVELAGEAMIVASLYVPAMDWYLVAQVPVAEIFAITDEISHIMWLVAFVITLLFLLMSQVLSNSITAPINELAQLFQRMGAGKADLTVQISQNHGAELNALVQGFNGFIDKIRHVAQQIKHTSDLVSDHAQNLSSAALQSFEQNRQQQKTSRVVTEAISQMETTVAEIASNAATAADSTSNANQSSNAGRAQVESSMQHMQALAQDVKNVEEVTHQLASQTSQIDQILAVIQSVAEQTNLLALNAAIEAARAGEQGRGFAVVADEVRHLAARTQKSTAEINSVIHQLRQHSQSAVEAVNLARHKAEQSVERSQLASEQLLQISSDVGLLESMNIQIAAATEEQSMVAANLSQQLLQMNLTTDANVAGAQNLRHSAEELARVATELEQLAGNFGL
jgi:methyl-accepting chemotaxis protein